jgi:magnesium chelatase subunit D
MTATPEIDAQSDATLAASLLAIDPASLGGVSLRGGAGPARDRWLARLRASLPPAAPWRRVPHNIGDDGLLGGLDLPATLQAGRPIAQRGVLAAADGGVVLLAMAERVSAMTVARLAAALDEGAVALQRDGLALRLPARFGVVALDEGLADDERPPAALLDRLAFHVDLGMVDPRPRDGLVDPHSRDGRLDPYAPDAPAAGAAAITDARARLPTIQIEPEILDAVCATAMALGIASLRAPILALRAATAIAALDGRPAVTAADAATAARLVLAPRATRLPEAAASEPEDPEPPEPDANQQDDQQDQQPNLDQPLADIVLEAARAALPPDVLARLLGSGAPQRVRSTGKAGAVHRSQSRGRPIGVAQGELRMGARLHLVETLKAAAPWQKLRRIPPVGEVSPAEIRPVEIPPGQFRRLEVRRGDFRIMRFRHRSQTLTIFVVDASGSSALNRLAEAKGAVELLLADCYVRRDKVALVAFRGKGADLLLPPTNALARAKRCLAGLPGGGGTPIAAGLDAAALLADAARRAGMTPIVTLLTDGRANVAADGSFDRTRAEAEAIAAARRIRAAGYAALLIDTAPRPDERTSRLAAELGARYLKLPRADAAGLAAMIQETARASAPTTTTRAAA